MSTRLTAAKALSQTLHHRQSLTEALAQVICDEEQRPFVQMLCYGVMRHLEELQWTTAKLLKKPLSKKEKISESLLLLGLFELKYGNTPHHAVVNETLKACDKNKRPWIKKTINAVLRNYLRQSELLRPDTLPAQTLHPAWLLNKLQVQYPNDWSNLCQHNCQQGPLTLRVNKQQYSREAYKQILERAGLQATECKHSEVGLRLLNAVPVNKLPGFFNGSVSVQDEAGQLVSTLLTPQSDACLLDACCAPGSKFCHLLEQTPGLQLTGLDISEARLQQVHENLARLKLPTPNAPKLIAADISKLSSWRSDEQYDCILLDAPCSATGVIRRHPDIKWLRQAEDIPQLAKTQKALLSTLWPVLKPGGKLLYSTCSVLQEENDSVISLFIKETGDAVSVPLEASWGRATEFGRQILPGDEMMDGFYYALLQKGG